MALACVILNVTVIILTQTDPACLWRGHKLGISAPYVYANKVIEYGFVNQHHSCRNITEDIRIMYAAVIH